MPIVKITSEFRDQLVDVVKEYINEDVRGFTDEDDNPDEYQPPRIIGFLAEDLTASTDPRLAWSAQPSADMHVWTEDSDGVMTISDPLRTEEIYSKRDHLIKKDTFVEAEFKRNKWQLIDANCNTTEGL